MDANELATIAFDAMPLDVLAEADKGQVWGVLQMALRTLEAQHESLLTEADQNAADAKRLWLECEAKREAAIRERNELRAELTAARATIAVERDRALQASSALSVKLSDREAELRNRDANLSTLVKDRDTSFAERNRLLVAYNSVSYELHDAKIEANQLQDKLDAMTKERDELRNRAHATQDVTTGTVSLTQVPSIGRIHYGAQPGHIEA